MKEEKAKKSGTQRDTRTAENNEASEEGFCPGHGEENGETGMVGLSCVKVDGVSHRLYSRGTGTETGSAKME